MVQRYGGLGHSYCTASELVSHFSSLGFPFLTLQWETEGAQSKVPNCGGRVSLRWPAL